jgi:hypothetical protein
VLKRLLVLVCAVLFGGGFPVSAFAAEAPAPGIQLGARVQQYLAWLDQSKELTLNQNEDLSESKVDLMTNSYWRAKFTSADKKVGAHVEIGLKSTVGYRHVYGYWESGSFRLLAGNTDNWHGAAYWNNQKMSASSSLDLKGWGKLWAPRRNQVQINWSQKKWGIQLALERSSEFDAAIGVDVYQSFPRASFSAQFKAEHFSTTPSLAFVRYDLEGVPSAGDDYLDAWAVILPLKFNFSSWEVIGELHHGQNVALGYSGYPSLAGPVFLPNAKYEDTTVTGGYLDMAYKLESLTIALGLGFETFENDAWKNHLGYAEDTNTRKIIYLSFPYKLHRYLTLHPEVNFLDHGDNPADGRDLGTEIMAGVLFRFVF